MEGPESPYGFEPHSPKSYQHIFGFIPRFFFCFALPFKLFIKLQSIPPGEATLVFVVIVVFFYFDFLIKYKTKNSLLINIQATMFSENEHTRVTSMQINRILPAFKNHSPFCALF